MNRQATIHASMDAVMQAFLETPNNQVHLREHSTKIEWLRDYRTVGFFMPRQTGATSWLLKQLLGEPDSLFITRWRANIIVNFDAEGKCDVFSPKTSMLSDSVQKRIVEPFDLSQWIKRGQLRIEPLKLLIIDGSSAVFNNIRINKFHDWLEQSPGVTKDTVVIRIN